MTSLFDNGLRTFHIASIYLTRHPAGALQAGVLVF